MENIAQLGIKVDSTDIKKATNELNNLTNASGKTEKSVDNLSAKTSILNAKNAVLAIATSATVSQLVKMSDTWTSISSRLNLATKSTEEYTKAQQELFKIAQTTKTSLEGTVDLYSRIARSTESLKLSQDTLLSITETINKTGIISGATTQQMEAGLMQLGQAFSAGALRGEELNSILEQMPRLAKAIADGMNIEVGALKSVAAEGKITSKVLIDAITSQADSINNEFSSMAMTIDQASTTAGNSILALVGKLNDATGASSDTANAIKEFSQFLDDNADAIVEWGVIAYASTSQLIDGVNFLYETLENTAQLILSGINTTVYTALSSISGAILSIVESMDSLGIGSSGAVEKVRAINNSLNQSYSESKQLAIDSGNELSKAYDKMAVSVEDRIKMMTVEKQISMENAEMAKVVSDEQTKTSTKKIELTKEEIKALKDAQKAEEDKNKALLEITQIGMNGYEKSLLSIADKLNSYAEAGLSVNQILEANTKLLAELNAQTLSETLLEDLSYYERKVQLQSDSLAKELELQGISYSNAVLNIENSDKTIEQKERLIALETELYELSIAKLELDRNTEFQETMKSFQDEMLESQIELNSAVWDFGDGFEGASNKVSKLSKSLAALTNAELKNKKEISKINKKYEKEFTKYAGDVEKTKELEIQYTQESDSVNQANFNNQIQGYANLAGAMSTFFEEGSKGAEAFAAVQKALSLVSLISGIMQQASLPYPYNILAMVSTAAVGFGFLGGGGGGGGSSSPSKQEIDKFNIESTYNPMIDKLDRQIELLESIDKNGSAAKIGVDLAALTYERDYKLFVNESYTELHSAIKSRWSAAGGTAKSRSETEAALEEYLGFNLADRKGSSEGYKIDTYALTQGENFMRLIEAANTSLIQGTHWATLFDKDWKKAGSPRQMMEARIAEYTNEFQALLSDYTLALLDSMDELKDAKEDFKGFYDDITGTSFYANQDLNNAFKEVNKYLAGKPLTEYLQSEVENISKLEEFLTEDKINTLLMEDPTKLKEQLDIIEDLREQTGLTFENGAEDALNYLDAIELVSEAMTTSTANIKSFYDSFKSDDELAQSLATQMGETLANTYDELAALFVKLESDTLGLTDADLELLESNISFIERLEDEQLAAQNKALQTQKDYLQDRLKIENDYYKTITSSISSISSILSTLDNAIEKLRGASETSETSLSKFYLSMAETQSLIGGNDYDAIKESLSKTVGYSSVLMSTKNFASQEEMAYAQQLAANQLESMDLTLNDELDYLEKIEENTRNTVAALTQSISNMGTQISDSISNQPDYSEIIDKVNGIKDSNTNFVNEVYKNTYGREADEQGLSYWVNQLNTGGLGKSNIQSAMAAAAVVSGEISKSKYVEIFYQLGLGRSADSEALKYWENYDASIYELYDIMRSVAVANGDTYTPFANGGIVTSPTLGLIGEAGYSEAVIPLKNPNDPLNQAALINEVRELRSQVTYLNTLNEKQTATQIKTLSETRMIKGLTA